MTVLPKAPLILITQTLKSTLTRISATGDPLGIRRIGTGANNASKGILGGIGNALKKLAKFVGFVFGTLTRFLPFNASQVFSIIVGGYFTLKTFDWNQTDASIEARIKANNKSTVDAIAPLIGASLGWGAVRLANFAIGKLGAKPAKGQKTPGINIPVISAKVGLALAKESQEEIKAHWNNFVKNAQRAQTENLILGFLLHARSIGMFGWEEITTPRPNGSFAAKIDEKIESLPAQWENFAEELLEEFEDAIIEAGYVVSFEIDDYFLAQKAVAKDAAENGRGLGIGFSS